MYAIIDKFLKGPIEHFELNLLDNVYTSSRYPSDNGMIASGKPTVKESIELFEIAKNIFETV